MRLIDLQPQWHLYKGKNVAFTFLCPHCQKVWLSCTRVGLSYQEQFEAFIDKLRDGLGLKGWEVVPCRPGYAWGMKDVADFNKISVTPSLDASPSGHWHGHITAGAIT